MTDETIQTINSLASFTITGCALKRLTIKLHVSVTDGIEIEQSLIERTVYALRRISYQGSESGVTSLFEDDHYVYPQFPGRDVQSFGRMIGDFAG
jgi:hypothetical protein